MVQSASNHPDINDPNVFVLYRYKPSLPGAMIFFIGFLIATCLHAFQASRRRTFYFIPLIVGGCFETIGYIGRALSSHNQWNLNFYLIQALTLLVAPALLAASIYMILGRIIRYVDGEECSPIPARYLTKIFVAGDVLAFATQGGGGGIMASAKTFKLGEHIVVAGLLLQIFFFSIFVIVAGIFHKRILLNPTVASSSTSWKKYLYTLYAASLLILVRSVFRVIEYLMGNDGFLMRHELFMYIFDSILILAAMVLFNLVHPGKIIGRSGEKDVAMELQSCASTGGSVGGLVQTRRLGAGR